jgi:hypothetical protein
VGLIAGLDTEARGKILFLCRGLHLGHVNFEYESNMKIPKREIKMETSFMEDVTRNEGRTWEGQEGTVRRERWKGLVVRQST